MEWIFPEQPQDVDLIDFILKNRKIKDQSSFLNPSLDMLGSPFDIYGMKDGVEHIADAIKKGKKIFIHGDFDVDGITATSLLWNFLYRDLGANVIPFIPNRFTDGYGLSEENVKKIIGEGGELIVSVDCGIKDIELVGKYSDQIDFIITDHHTIRSSDEAISNSKKVGKYLISSKAKAVIHPALSRKSFKEICGAFVAWKFCQGINEYLSAGIDCYKYLDLVALGTICDVMPLIEENRVAVRFGIERMRDTQNIGLRALFEASLTDITKADPYSLGFVIGPRINASGRLESAMDAVRLLTTESKPFAFQLAQKLNELNFKRQELTKRYLDEAESILKEYPKENKLFFLFGEEWPEGILGLIAGRLTEKYNKPVLVGSRKDGIIKGSARSIESFNIANALRKFSTNLLRHGGHAQAAGFSLKEDSFEALKDLLLQEAEEGISFEDLKKKLIIDALINNSHTTVEFVSRLKALEPFGQGNPTPLLSFKGTTIRNLKVIGKDQSHAKFNTSDVNIDFLFFRFKDRFDLFSSDLSRSFDIAGNLDIDSWNGYKKVVFKVKDLRMVE